jgi:hypothetical protein
MLLSPAIMDLVADVTQNPQHYAAVIAILFGPGTVQARAAALVATALTWSPSIAITAPDAEELIGEVIGPVVGSPRQALLEALASDSAKWAEFVGVTAAAAASQDTREVYAAKLYDAAKNWGIPGLAVADTDWLTQLVSDSDPADPYQRSIALAAAVIYCCAT